MEYLLLYLLFVIPCIIDLAIIVVTIASISMFIWLCVILCGQTYKEEEYLIDRIKSGRIKSLFHMTKKWFKYNIIFILVPLFILVFIPTKNELLVIYLVPKVVHSEMVQDTSDEIAKLPKNLLILANQKLSKLIKEGLDIPTHENIGHSNEN